MIGGRVPMLLAVAGLFAVVGLAIATYLTVVHYAHQPIACSSVGDCELVNSSEYAKLAGVPVALLGAFAYVSMFGLIAATWIKRDGTLLVAAWGVALASFAFSAYLTYVEVYVLEAICVYCVASACVVSALFATLSAAVWLARDRHEVGAALER